MIQLVYTIDGHEFKTPVPPGESVLGRSSSADIRLQDKSISGKHLRLELAGAVLRAVDLGSSNGTLVNNRRVSEQTLHEGDVVRLGRVEIHIQGATPRSAPAGASGETPPAETAVSAPPPASPPPVEAGETPPAGLPVPAGGGAVEVLPPSPDPAAGGRETASSSGKTGRKKLMVVVVAVGVLLLAAVLLTPPPKPPVKVVRYESQEFWADLEKGADACRSGRFSEADAIWKEADAKWQKLHPDQSRPVAQRLSRMIRPLVGAEATGDFDSLSWMDVEDEATDILDNTINLSPPIEDLLEDMVRQTRREAGALRYLRQAEEKLTAGEFDEVGPIVAKVPAESRYLAAAQKLAEAAADRKYKRRRDKVFGQAEKEKWGAAIDQAAELLALRPDDNELRTAKQAWEAHRNDRSLVDRAEKLIKADTVTSLEQAIEILEAIAEGSRYALQRDGKLRAARVRLREKTIEEYWMAYNAGALERLPEMDDAYGRDPQYLNTMKDIREIQRLLREGDEFYEKKEYEQARDTWDQVRNVARDRDHKANRMARDRMRKVSPDVLAADYKKKGADAFDEGAYKTARRYLERARKYGADVEEQVTALKERALRLYREGVMDSIHKPHTAVDKLGQALDCLLPTDEEYGKVHERLRKEREKIGR